MSFFFSELCGLSDIIVTTSLVQVWTCGREVDFSYLLC